MAVPVSPAIAFLLVSWIVRVILNEDMKNFTSNMNMNQKMFDGFLNCELGMFGSIQKNHNLVDYQKTFYSAATFNPTYPNHKDPSPILGME